ncbi:MAG: Phenylalanine--tRNA ligase beta subunit [Thermotoga sp. 50_1627]|nr:MAG: Phenylalanine--tRNA ligase beta subunit [Thermotoga sp. 50_64]KUK25465.1 MAG: Phenylalanine--tRNA ligase beta subunit [Thermotoga sp. 50_1627]HBT38996.1 phenylalanine--tRNA ligase subunit beta [Pseudothermotoga sp.]HCO97722.1 phenylalanine--tRNA ligase subunit beta [Pseudothermotoga sp.]
MQVPVEWLKELVDIDFSVEELAHRLTMAGVSVERIFNPFASGKIVSAIVVETFPHPNAERLKVCRVFDGSAYHTTITSDMNVKENRLVAIAYPGTRFADGTEVRQTTIREVLSEVVMCSLQELGLEEKSDHVHLIDEDLEVGLDLIQHWKLNEPVLDLDITPNRPDCLGIVGVAREVAALFNKDLKLPQPEVEIFDEPVERFVSVQIEDVEGCPRYCAGYVRSSKVKDSPLWMKRRLMACGVRPINNIVDASNYVMLLTGHPVHVFDYSKVKDGRIVVRCAKKDEQVVLLDERTYKLKGIETLITDGENILAVGGVMGAQDSGVTQSTEELLLEVAYFDPVRIRRTCKALNIKSDASHRFERGVDPNDADYVMNLLIDTIQRVAGGLSARGFVDVYPRKIERKSVTLRKERMRKILGIDVPDGEVSRILESLGMEVRTAQDGWTVLVPTYRPDISIEEDLIEEVGRLFGYEKVQSEAPRILASAGGWSDYQKFRRNIKQLVRSCGFNEVVNLSFCNSSIVRKLTKQEPLKLDNPMVEDMDSLRPSLLFGLIDCVAYNVRRQNRDVKFFEIAKVYGLKDSSIFEREKLGMIASGKLEEDDYTDTRSVSLLWLKGTIEEIGRHLNLNFEFEPATVDWLTPGRRAFIYVNGEQVGCLGMLTRSFNEVYDFKGEVYFAELDIQTLYESFNPVRAIVTPAPFPYVRRDISLLLPVGSRAGDILRFLRTSHEFVENAGVSDVYTGKGLAENTISVTFYVIYRAPDRSLTDEEVNELFENTIRKVEETFNVRRRF